MQNEQRATRSAANPARPSTGQRVSRPNDEAMAELRDRVERIGHLTGIAPVTVAEIGWHMGWTFRECGIDWEQVDFDLLEQELAAAPTRSRR